jgi:bacterioferritin-associated ferredoxin
MIVCSCNVLSDGDVKACLRPGPGCPRTPAQVYRCLGCSPNCGRCVRTIREIMDRALAEAQSESGCGASCCPVGLEHAAAEPPL